MRSTLCHFFQAAQRLPDPLQCDSQRYALAKELPVGLAKTDHHVVVESALQTDFQTHSQVDPVYHVGVESSGGNSLYNVVVDDEPLDGILWAAETFGGVSAVIDDVRRLTVTATEDFTGTTTIRLTATDIFGARGSGTLVVEVRAQVDSPMAGDFDRSGGVDLDDFFALVDELGNSVFTPGFDASFDLNDDGRITFDDFFLFLDIYEAHRLDP